MGGKAQAELDQTAHGHNEDDSWIQREVVATRDMPKSVERHRCQSLYNIDVGSNGAPMGGNRQFLAH